MRRNLFFLIVLMLGGTAIVSWLWFDYRLLLAWPEPVMPKTSPAEVEPMTESMAVSLTPFAPQFSEPRPIASVWRSIPFTSQAPNGEWNKSAFQDGCEEASTLMVWLARTGKTLPREAVRSKLIEMAQFERERLGHGMDTDASDTNEYLLKQYFSITDARVVNVNSLDELKTAVMEGLVIVPTNGRVLGNPNFTAPGPLQHMLVITGYDMELREFITHDPGTRKGEGYRYPEQVLYAALREYPTGQHLPILTEHKVMIIVPFAARD